MNTKQIAIVDNFSFFQNSVRDFIHVLVSFDPNDSFNVFCFIFRNRPRILSVVFDFSRIRYDFNCQEIVDGRTNCTKSLIVDKTQKFYGKRKSMLGENENS